MCVSIAGVNKSKKNTRQPIKCPEDQIDSIASLRSLLSPFRRHVIIRSLLSPRIKDERRVFNIGMAD